MKNVLTALGVIALCLAIFWGTKMYYTWQVETVVKEDSKVLLEKVKTVSKLITVEGYFSEIYDYQEHWGYDLSPFRKKALIRVKAKVSVGYDLTKMNFEADTKTKTITISNMPDPEILSIDHDLDYYDITEGTFNTFEEADYNKMNAAAKEKVRGLVNELPTKAHTNAKGVKVLVERLDLDAQSMKDLGYQLREQHADLAFVSGSVIDGKPLLAVSLGKAFSEATGIKAVDIIKQISPAIKGGGGGQPDFATAGGKEPEGMAEALRKAEALLA